MTLEEKLRAYAAKGELVHLSLVATVTGFSCHFGAASPAGGYARGEAYDPVEAIEKALKASPTRPVRVSKPKADDERFLEVAQQVSDGEEGGRLTAAVKEGELRADWTTP